MKMEYEIKAGPQGHFYLPKRIREALGTELKLVPIAKAGALYPKDADLRQVICSLKIIIEDLELRIEEHGDYVPKVEGGKPASTPQLAPPARTTTQTTEGGRRQ